MRMTGRIDVNSPGLTTETELPIKTQVANNKKKIKK